MTWAMVNMGPFNRGTGLYLSRKMWDPDRLRPLDSLWNPEYDRTTRTILLDLYTIQLLG